MNQQIPFRDRGRQKRRAIFLLRVFVALLFLTLPTSAFAKSKIDGDWEGTIDNGKLLLIFHIKASGGTTVDSPRQQVSGLWAVVRLDGKSVEISMPAAGAEFKGTVEKSRITGVFTQTGSSWPLVLTRSGKKTAGE